MSIMMSTLLILLLLIGLLPTRLPLAFLTGLIALGFAYFNFGIPGITLLTSRTYSFLTQYVFIAVPMFVFMAAILDRSGIARDLFRAMRVLSGDLRGGVAVQTLIVALVLAAMSGIIGGEIVLLGILALPQMLNMGYDKKLAIGTVLAGGSLGTMMPPSIVLIVYGMTSNVPISDLFVGAITPTILLVALYASYILCRAYFSPGAAPTPAPNEIPKAEQRAIWRSIALPLIVAAGVLGSIYAGIASVTESACVGVAGMLLATFFRKELNLTLLKGALQQTLSTCGMIIWIGVGATLLIGVYNLMGGVHFVKNLILGLDLSPILIIIIMMLILVLLGMFLDWVGIALLTMPIFVPIIISLGYDPVWFGVLFCLNMQISYLSPPFGPAIFYLKSVAPEGITLGDMFASVWPFICLQVLALSLLIAFPQIVLWAV
ncbi:TRAP transporter large permease subunit [Buttiauxella selenatireducens]|uniref:TRAP transporter large permease protein n=1 Tax=Buttiauxella selenatireducens TaxID=3073902 RepID=A0ABY9S5B6_9ENTR|nr:TRAP transporter large permease subunit [Buttiauxella sp. R73]WMY72597.1 TRAP transporter large permease subunit [Buttiauxella sp. R73]